MAVRKQARNMTLDEIHEELEAASIDKKFDDIFKARAFIASKVKSGIVKFAGRGEFDEGLAAATAEAKAKAEADKKAAKDKAAADAKAAKQAERDKIKAEKQAERDAKKAEREAARPKKDPKPKKNITWDESAGAHPLMNKRVFTRHGNHLMIAVGTYEGDSEPTRARVAVGPDEGTEVALSSCRASAVDSSFRDKYTKFKDQKTPSGKPSIGVDDEVRAALAGKDLQALKAIGAENDIDMSVYSHLNNGMVRMTLGNKLRGRAQKGKGVIVDGEVIVASALKDEQG